MTETRTDTSTSLSAALSARKAQRQAMQTRRRAAHEARQQRLKAQEAAYRDLAHEALSLRERASEALRQADDHDAQAQLLRQQARLLRRSGDAKALRAHALKPAHLAPIALPAPPRPAAEPLWRRKLRELSPDRYVLVTTRAGYYAGREHARGAPLRSRSGNVRSFASYVEALQHRRELTRGSRKYEHTYPVLVGEL